MKWNFSCETPGTVPNETFEASLDGATEFRMKSLSLWDAASLKRSRKFGGWYYSVVFPWNSKPPGQCAGNKDPS